MTQTLTNQGTRQFHAYTYDGRFYIREWSSETGTDAFSQTRQQAWDKARAQLLPVTFVSLDGVEKDLGVVASELVKVTLTEAAWKNTAAKQEAAQELAAEKAKWDWKESQETSIKTSTGPTCFQKSEAAEVGVYRFEGQIYRVVWNGAHTKRYGQLLVINAGGKPRWDYDAAKGVVFKLKKEHHLSAAEAKEFGNTHHFCVCCRKKLTVKLSIERGVGPVCWEKYGFSD